MNTQAKAGYDALTEREKQTLRLIVRGHDAKSAARHLGLSVHTINERLHDARRKLAVSSSREAARLVLEREAGPAGPHPESLVPQQIGVAGAPGAGPSVATPGSGGRRIPRLTQFAIGAVIMTIVLGLILLAAQPGTAPSTDASTATSSSPDDAARTAELDAVARRWLALVDQGRWEESWKATGTAFRKLNGLKLWTEVSGKVRTPLGAVSSRTLISHQELPAPPNGFEVLKFRTGFANKPGATETVTLERQGGEWRVVAIIIE